MTSGLDHPPRRGPVSLLRAFLSDSASGGIALMAAAALALIVANTPLAEAYGSTLHLSIGSMSVEQWINDGLMALFFLLVGLEIKRELLEGQLAKWDQRALPGIAALGGMIAPAIVYLAFNLGGGGHPRGWAIASATDIAFSLGVLALLGNRVPVGLRIFLTALAIIDDLGAIVIIALFYAGELNLYALGGAVLVLAALFGLNRAGVMRLWPYLLLGPLLWGLVLFSGVHATLAGVALALAIPARPRRNGDRPPLARLEHALQPWVTFAVVPIFGFANAGISFAGLTLGALLQPVPIGVALGLLIGKQVGVFTAAALVIRLGWAKLPPHATWPQLYGVALLCGIGFTMSLFIGILAFPGQPLLLDEVKIGVLGGSIGSALLGAGVLVAVGGRRSAG